MKLILAGALILLFLAFLIYARLRKKKTIFTHPFVRLLGALFVGFCINPLHGTIGSIKTDYISGAFFFILAYLVWPKPMSYPPSLTDPVVPDFPELFDRLMLVAEGKQCIKERFQQTEFERDELKKQLECALRRVKDAEKLNDPAARNLIANLRKSGDPTALLALLIHQRNQNLGNPTKLNREIIALAYLKGEIDTARTAIDQLLADNPADLSAFNWLGLFHYLQGDLSAAEQSYRKILDIAPDDETMKAGVYVNLGLIYLARGQLDQAETFCRNSLAINKKTGNLKGMADDYGCLGVISITRVDQD